MELAAFFNSVGTVLKLAAAAFFYALVVRNMWEDFAGALIDGPQRGSGPNGAVIFVDWLRLFQPYGVLFLSFLAVAGLGLNVFEFVNIELPSDVAQTAGTVGTAILGYGVASGLHKVIERLTGQNK